MAAKNLLGLPWRVAFALQADGWILRNAIVWHKPNAMPESVRDRLNCRYELVFLLVKSRPTGSTSTPSASRTQHRPSGPHAGGRHPATASARHRRCTTGRSAEVRPARRRGRRRAQRYGTGRQPRATPERPQPRRRVVHPHPPLRRPALRRVPRSSCPLGASRPAASPAAPCSDMFTRHRHHRPGRPPPRPALHRHRASPAFAALAAERLARPASPTERRRLVTSHAR